MITCALIGIGYWGTKLKRYIESSPYFHLKYICNSKSNLNEVWKDKEVKAVIIATPNETHYDIASSALMYNKHVLCEKPLALTQAQCEKLESLARNRHLKILTDYTFTFSRSLQKIKELIKGKEVGTIRSITVSWKQLGRFGKNDVYWLLGSHALSVINMFVPLKKLWWERRDLIIYKNKRVETGILSFQRLLFQTLPSLKNEIRGQVFLSLNYPIKERKVVFYGTKGTIIYDGVCQPSILVQKYKRSSWRFDPKTQIEYNIDESNNLKYVIDYFYKVIAGGEKDNLTEAMMITSLLEKLSKKRRN